MILISYPYAAPPVRLPNPAADGRIRLRLSLRAREGGSFTALTDPHVGFSEADVKLLTIAPAVRGQLIGGAETIIMGAVPDFHTVAQRQSTHYTANEAALIVQNESLRIEAMAEGGKAAMLADKVKEAHARLDALVEAVKVAARKLEGARGESAYNIAKLVAQDLRRAVQ